MKYLVAQGIVNPTRLGIADGSLWRICGTRRSRLSPDVCGAAVAIVPPSDLTFLLESIPAYWEAARKIMYARMAYPGTPEGKKILEEESPEIPL